MSTADWYGAQNGQDMNYLMIQQMIQQAVQMQTNTRIAGAIVADSGTLQQLSVKGDLTLDSGGTVTAAATYPATAARATMGAGGFATFNSTPVQTLGFNIDGSGFIGVGGSTMSWTAAGVVSIPVAAIGALTIAQVGGGVLGGTYKTATGTGARLELDTAGFRAYNASNLNTVLVDAATGNITLTSPSSGSTSAALIWKDNGGTARGYALADAGSAGMWVAHTSGFSLELTASKARLSQDSPSTNTLTPAIEANLTGVQVRGAFYPGAATAAQATASLGWEATNLYIQQTGGNGFQVTGLLKLANLITGGASGALPTPTKYLEVLDSAGNGRYIPCFSQPNPWIV